MKNEGHPGVIVVMALHLLDKLKYIVLHPQVLDPKVS
jgi:hypothetical protein